MKKIISLKMFSLIVLTAALSLSACRQEDENDFLNTETSPANSKTEGKYQSEAQNNQDLKETDPPVKNGTHWRVKK